MTYVIGVSIFLIIILCLIVLFLWRTARWRSLLFVVGAAFCLFLYLQKPWRTDGAMHIVHSEQVEDVPIMVLQVHDGHGLNASYVVAKNSQDKWHWFAIGNDDLYWYTVGFDRLASGEVVVSKYGHAIGIFDPHTFKFKLKGKSHTAAFTRLQPPQTGQ